MGHKPKRHKDLSNIEGGKFTRASSKKKKNPILSFASFSQRPQMDVS